MNILKALSVYTAPDRTVYCFGKGVKSRLDGEHNIPCHKKLSEFGNQKTYTLCVKIYVNLEAKRVL